MRQQAVNNPQLAVRDELLLCLTVGGREEHVARERHDVGFRFDPAERRLEVTIGVAAYVAMPPFPPHPDQIVGVHWREISFPEPTQKILKRGEAEPAPGFLVVEIRAEPHDRRSEERRVGKECRSRRSPYN